MRVGLLAILLGLIVAQSAQATTYTSAGEPAQLIELFTSQGCSSCPAAEQWLSELQQHPGLWRTQFPLAWHVDYWDHLGWKDKFSSPQYTQRQYRYHHLGLTQAVYTPQMVLNGAEWFGLQARPQAQLPEPVQTSDIRLTVSLQDKLLTASASRGGLLNVALIRRQHSQRIYRGENAGRRLNQAFIVLGFSQTLDEQGQWQTPLPATTHELAPDALIAWLSEPGTPTPLAIVGGPLHGRP